MTDSPTDWVLNQCRELGFALACVCSAEASTFADHYDAWIAEKKHGEMAYLADHAEAVRDPNRVLEGVRSAVMVADLYHTRNDPPETPIVGQGRIARYARGRDYHTSIKARLHTLADRCRERWPEEQFRAVVDTAPIPEREFAVRAGLGWVGKHTLLIHPKIGSWLAIGGLLTTMDLPSDTPTITDHCGTCTRCIDACPTNAITPYSINASRCISYLTIEHRSSIDPAFFSKMQDWVAGCDICQEVCPHNSPRPGKNVGHRHPDHEPARQGFDLLDILGWDTKARSSALKGSALKRIKLDQFRRNAVIAAGNAINQRNLPALAFAIQTIADDPAEPEIVRSAARAVLKQQADQQRPSPEESSPRPEQA